MSQAIREAIKDGVDIISMSWTIKHKRGGKGSKQMEKDFQDLRDVLRSTVGEGFGQKDNPRPLMFCAASDDGMSNTPGEEYPSAAEGEIFRIGAAEETGQSWPNVSDQKTVHFFMPGVDFNLPENSVLDGLRTSNNSTKPQDSIERSGSSIATALAAGLAALLIHCTKLGAYHTIAKQEVSDHISLQYIDKSMYTVVTMIKPDHLKGHRAPPPILLNTLGFY